MYSQRTLELAGRDLAESNAGQDPFLDEIGEDSDGFLEGNCPVKAMQKQKVDPVDPEASPAGGYGRTQVGAIITNTAASSVDQADLRRDLHLVVPADYRASDQQLC